MRALLVTPPGLGHLYPLIPLADSLRLAGHDVSFATTAAFVPRIQVAGFEAHSVGDREGQDPVDLFDEDVVTNLVSLAEEVRPDVIVHDHTTSVAAIVAELRGVPNVYSSVGIMRPPWMIEAIKRCTGPIWESFDVELPTDAGLHRWLYLDRCPRSLQPPEIDRVSTAHSIRPLSYEDASEDRSLVNWLDGRPGQPLIYVTLGTVFNTEAPFRSVLDAMAKEPVDLVVALGRGLDPAAFGELPSNVRIEEFVRQDTVLARSDAVVCHGGSGTVMQALTRGVPMVLLPQGADQVWNAPMCERRGVAVALSAEDASATALRGAVKRILDDGSYRIAAEELATEIAAMPGLEYAVSLVERVVATNTPVLG